MNYRQRARDLRLCPIETTAFVVLCTYADAYNACPSCETMITRDEATRLAHVYTCAHLVAECLPALDQQSERKTKTRQLNLF